MTVHPLPTTVPHPAPPVAGARLTTHELEVLDEIQHRVLWLAVRMVHAANDRSAEEADGIKVGGHQASSASLATVMTALWFRHLAAADRVAVKPHAAPVFHAIQYLLGNLDPAYLTTLRRKGGLQAYPSRTKDPDGVDFSTGSVGLGPVAALFAAATRRYVDAHFGPRPASRFIGILGDAELDEGNVWEAVADPAAAALGNVTWIVDFNRQSLDRVVPGARIHQWRGQFEAAGWHVVELKYGQRLQAAFERPGGERLRQWIDDLPNEQYQSIFGLPESEVRARFLDGAPPEVAALVADVPDDELAALVTDLGGHDLQAVLDALAECDRVQDRPSVLFAYTVKGWSLPTAGNSRNHSALLTADQIDALRASVRLSPENEWDRLPADSPAGIWAEQRGRDLSRPQHASSLEVRVPRTTSPRTNKPLSTQEAFGRVLVDLARDPQVAPYLVTTAPDVATSTNLAGFINKLGVFSPDAKRAWVDDPMLPWRESPSGQHIELGISEMNLFLLLGQLGLSWDISEQPLIPIGTVYDPFVLRGLDAFIYGTYSGSRFVLAGTPSGITLAPEGGAHQSTMTPSVGLELPGVTFLEPAYAAALDWMLCDAVGRIAQGHAERRTAVPAEDGAFYFRLTTRPIDQAPFEAARRRLGETILRQQVLAGAYVLRDAYAERPELKEASAPLVHVVASGAVIPEALAAANELADEGIAANVVDVTSLDRLYLAWQRTLKQGVRTATAPSLAGSIRTVFGQRAPIVSVHDASSHAMAWLGSALGVPCVPLGVDEFGQSGSINDLYEAHDLLPGSIVNGALAALSLA